MSLLIFNYVAYSSSPLWAACEVLEVSPGWIRLWLLAHSICRYKEQMKLLYHVVQWLQLWSPFKDKCFAFFAYVDLPPSKNTHTVLWRVGGVQRKHLVDCHRIRGPQRMKTSPSFQ